MKYSLISKKQLLINNIHLKIKSFNTKILKILIKSFNLSLKFNLKTIYNKKHFIIIIISITFKI